MALLVWLAVAAAGAASGAEEADNFSATVAVDASAETVIKARETARADGQRRAFAAVAGKLGANPAKLPKLDDRGMDALIASFEVAGEKMSATRYVADYTFHFRPEETRRALRLATAQSDDTGKPAVVIPVYQTSGPARLWDDANPWRQAWDQQPAGGGPRLAVPLGDAGDIAAIDAERARAGNAEALAAIARRNGADDAIVALAAMRGPPNRPSGLDVTLKRYRAGRLADSRTAAVAANPGEGEAELLRRAVASIIGDIASGWKPEAAAAQPDQQQGSLTAVMPIASLDDWMRAKERLATVPAIRKIALVALSRQEATIEIGYGGTIDQLTAGLAEISVDLVRGNPTWRLTRVGPARTP
jgi:hypothetical protein